MRAGLLLAALAWPAWCAADEPAGPLGYGPLPRGAWACLGSPRFVCDKPCRCVAFSPDGKLLAAAAGAVLLWDVQTGEQTRQLGRQEGEDLLGVRCSPDGKTLAARNLSGVTLWDLDTGKERVRLPDFRLTPLAAE